MGTTLIVLGLLSSHDHVTLLALGGTGVAENERYRVTGVEAGLAHELFSIGALELDIGARTGLARSSHGTMVPLDFLGEALLHISEHVGAFVQLGGRADFEQRERQWSVVPMLLATLGAEYELNPHWGIVMEATYCAGRANDAPQRELEMGTGVAYNF